MEYSSSNISFSKCKPLSCKLQNSSQFTPRIIFITVGCVVYLGIFRYQGVRNILSTVGDAQYRERYHDKCGVLNIPHTCVMMSPHDTELKKMWGTDHPHSTDDISHVYMISPTVLNFPYGTQGISHDTQGTEHPPRYSKYPLGY